MDAGKKKINDILNGNRQLIIPFFQRSYVWEKIYGSVSLKVWSRFHRKGKNISLVPSY